MLAPVACPPPCLPVCVQVRTADFEALVQRHSQSPLVKEQRRQLSNYCSDLVERSGGAWGRCVCVRVDRMCVFVWIVCVRSVRVCPTTAQTWWRGLPAYLLARSLPECLPAPLPAPLRRRAEDDVSAALKGAEVDAPRMPAFLCARVAAECSEGEAAALGAAIAAAAEGGVGAPRAEL